MSRIVCFFRKSKPDARMDLTLPPTSRCGILRLRFSCLRAWAFKFHSDTSAGVLGPDSGHSKRSLRSSFQIAGDRLIPSRPENGGFAALCFSFVRSSAPRNRRTQAAPNSSLSLRGKPRRCASSPGCSGYDARSCCARSARLDLRHRANAPRRFFPLRDKRARPRDPFGEVSKSILPAFSTSRPPRACLPQGAGRGAL